MKNINQEQNNRISNIKNDIYPTYNNLSYDKSLSPEKRLYDFLGKYYINLNGVKPNNILEITQPHKKEIVDFVLDLLFQSEQSLYDELLNMEIFKSEIPTMSEPEIEVDNKINRNLLREKISKSIQQLRQTYEKNRL